jgi:pyridoxine/pyridoxamine 5'-phosphate oxidase
MTRLEVVTFVRANPLATAATASVDGAPQAALVGVAVSDHLELVFDTLETTRKALNLRLNSRIAVVFGAAGAYKSANHDERCLQIEGHADFPSGDGLRTVQETIYFQQFPDGRSRMAWPHITYVRVRPVWLRYSDYNVGPPEIVEWHGEKLAEFISRP